MRFTGYTVAAANNKAYGGGMFVAPDAELDDGELDVVMIGEVGKLRFLANLPKVFKGTHVEQDEVQVFRAAAARAGAPTARSPSTPTASTSPTCRRRSGCCRGPSSVIAPPPGRGLSRSGGAAFGAKVALARATGPRSRPSGRGGGTTLPGPGAAATGARRDRPPRRAPDGGVDDRQRHQRQDDHRRDDRRVLAAGRPRAGPQPRRLEHDLGSGDRAARAARHARGCSRSTRPGCRASPTSSTRA